MTRPVLARLAGPLVAGLVLVCLVGPAGPAAPAASAVEPDTPLEVSIESMSPSVIPGRGRITLTGEVTNRSEDSWTDLNVYLLTSSTPFTTASELEAASATDPALEVGARLFEPGLYDEVGSLAPGSSTSFTLSVARKDLQVSGDRGVYWLGVHVLGALDGARDSVADGRARTFVPLMGRRAPSTTMSLVVPVTATVKRRADGRLANLPGWQEMLGEDGRLGRLLQLTGTSLDSPLTWVVDPAVLEAAQSVAEDNPSRVERATDGDPAEPSPGATESPSPSDDATEEPSGESPELSEEAQVAASWLASLQQQADEHTVLSTPYGNPDVAAMLRRDFPDTFEQATDLGALTMDLFGIDADPVIAPPGGYLPGPALRRIDPETPVILRDSAAPDEPGPLLDDVQGHRIVLTDTSAGQGGPGPTARYKALAMRQRIISEAAVHALSGGRNEPLVVSTPQTWDPGEDWEAAQLTSGLEAPWLTMVGLPTTSPGSSDQPYRGELVYPRREQRAEIPLANLLATQELSRVGDTYAALLTRNDRVDESLARTAMLGSSYTVRGRAHAAMARTRSTTQRIRSTMEKVTIDGPPFVTMSSEEGPIGVTIVNGLEETVTVGIKALVEGGAAADLAIEPSEPVSIGPGQRASVRLRATADDIGVHSVTLLPTNSQGDPLGSSTQFSVRSSQVGMVIWVIMGIGATVLVIASGVRIVRRVRSRGSTHRSAQEDTAG